MTQFILFIINSYIEMYQLKLHVTDTIEQHEELFDYNSDQTKQDETFKATTIYLQLPNKNNSPIYYFIHKSPSKIYGKFIHLQRRNKFQSNINENIQLISKKIVLLGGIKLEYKINDKGGRDLMLKCLRANDIPRQEGNKEKIEESLPYYVIRSFGGFPLKKGQILKLGKFELNLVEVYAQPNRQEYLASLAPQDILEVPPLSLKINKYCLQTNSSLTKPPFCRICYGEEDTQEDRLIRPCQCQSSIGDMHFICFRRWMKMRASKMREQGYQRTYDTKLLACEICKATIPKAIKIGTQLIPIFAFLDNLQPYIAATQNQPPSSFGLQAVKRQSSLLYITMDEQNQISVGRAPSNGFIIQNGTVSRKHAEIKLQNGQLMVKDVGSKFGTLVYDPDIEIKVSKKNSKAFQVKGTAFAFQLEKIE